MARTSYGGTTHAYTATGSNDPTKQVSVNRWNELHSKSEAGMLGFTKQSATISGNAIAVTGTLIEIQADGTLNTITPTDANEFDLIYLIAKSTATSVTITSDDSGGAGKIRLLSGDGTETLSTTSPMILMCRTIGSNKEWVQYGGGVVNSLNDIGNVNISGVQDNDLLAYDNSTSKWINQSPSEAGIITADSTTTFTNKTIDQDATGNSITNLADASIKASAGINATKIADGSVTSTEFQYINTLSSNAQTQLDTKITASSTDTLTNKTIDQDGTGNSITNIANASIKASAGIDATKIADGSVTSTEFQYINTLSSNAQTQLDAKQGTLSFGISSGDVTKAGAGIADDDFIRVDGTTFEGRSASQVLTDIGALGTSLNSAQIFVGNGSNVATGVTMSGDIAIDNAGATTIQTDAVDIAMLSATGTASSTTFLRGDNTWATAGGGAENTIDTKLRDEADSDPSYTSRTENDASTPIQIWSKTLDSSNENLYVRVKKNGSYTNVQIA